MINLDTFYASEEEILSGCPLFTAFRTADGTLFLECEERVEEIGRRFAEALPADADLTPLSIASAVEAVHSVFAEILPVLPDPDSFRLIADCSLDHLPPELPGTEPAVALSETLSYPPELSDIALGLSLGCAAYGVVEENAVISAAYTFVPLSDPAMTAGGVEIGVETREEHRNRGYATAAVRALAADLIERGIRVLFSFYTDNPASRCLAERLGFTCHATGFEIKMKGREEDAL